MVLFLFILGAEDLFEMGDLSGKYGYLNGKNEYNLAVRDMNLPMYGPHASLGRSVVLHANNVGGSRLVCANIEPKDSTKLSGVANFTANSNSNIDGYVRMVREFASRSQHEINRKKRFSLVKILPLKTCS